jgi:hypothetical protein
MLSIDGLVDSNLATVFHTLQYTSILLNEHYHNQTPMNGTFLQKCLGFLHSCLIELEGQLNSELSECLRLGMMVFLATTFRRPHSYEQPYCRNRASKLQFLYAATKNSNPGLPQSINFWLTLVCLISTNNIEESQVWASWKSIVLRGMSWDEIRKQVKQVMWLDPFHDDLGRRAFETLMTGPESLESPNVMEEGSSKNT